MRKDQNYKADCKDFDVECTNFDIAHKDYIPGFVDNIRRKVDIDCFEQDTMNCNNPYYLIAVDMDRVGSFGEHKRQVEDMRQGFASREMKEFDILGEYFEGVEFDYQIFIADFVQVVIIYSQQKLLFMQAGFLGN